MQQIDETRSGDGIGSQRLGLGLPLGAKARARAEHGPNKPGFPVRQAPILGAKNRLKIDMRLTFQKCVFSRSDPGPKID